MVNPDNTINSRIETRRNTDKASSDRPEGDAKPEKFREVYAVYEQKKPKDEFEEVEELLRKKKKEGKGLTAMLQDKGEGDTPVFKMSNNQDSGSFDDQERNAALLDEALEHSLADKPVKPMGKTASFVREEADIAQINPSAYVPPSDFDPQINQVLAKEPTPPPTRAQIQEIIDKIVDQVYKLEAKKGTTEIVVILNKEGPLKDVGIKVTETDTSMKQLNITIDNLTQDAKTLIEKSESQLLLALERKGYQVQMFVATTTTELPRLEKSNPSEDTKRERDPHQHQDENEERE